MVGIFLLSALAVSGISSLDDKPIYENPLAYVRSPECGLFLKASTYRGAKLKYLDAQIGRVVPIVHFQQQDIQLGLEAATWAVLGYHKGAFPLITQDFLISVPLMFRFYSFSGAIKFSHISSHRGDGFDLLWDKTLTPEEKQKIEMVERQEKISIMPPVQNYSRDFISGEIAQEIEFRSLKVKSYIQLAHIHKTIPHNLGRWFGGNGIELRYSNFYLAEDIHYYQDTETFDFAVQTGWLVSGDFAETRFCIIGYHGSDRRGQFLGRQMNELGIGIFIR